MWGFPSPCKVFVRAGLETTTPSGSPEKKESPPLSSSFFSPKISLTIRFIIYIIFTISDLWTWAAQTQPLHSSPQANPPVVSKPIKQLVLFLIFRMKKTDNGIKDKSADKPSNISIANLSVIQPSLPGTSPGTANEDYAIEEEINEVFFHTLATAPDDIVLLEKSLRSASTCSEL